CDLYLWGHAGSDYYPFTNPVEITPSATGWSTIDLSSYIPAGSTGVSLLFVNTSTSTNYKADARKTGSTDDHPSLTYGTIITYPTRFRWVVVGVDSQRRVDIYIANTAVKVYLWGYFLPIKTAQFDVSTSASSLLERQLEAKRELITPTSTISAELQVQKVVAISLSVSSEALSSLSRVLQASRTFTISSEAIAQLQRRIAAARTFTVTAGVSTTLQALITKFVTLSVATKPQALIEVAKSQIRKFSVTTRPYAFLKVKGKEEICGLPDHILDFNLRMQSLGQLRVDIAACSIGTLNVNIVGQIGTLNVNVTNATLNVNVTNSSLNVNVTNATLNVNVTNTTLNVNITNAQINANITNAQLNVYGQGGKLEQLYLSDYVVKTGYLTGGTGTKPTGSTSGTIYTVPSGYYYYPTLACFYGINTSTTNTEYITLVLYNSVDGKEYAISYLGVKPNDFNHATVTFPPNMRLNAGSYFFLAGGADIGAQGWVMGMRVPTSLEDDISRKTGLYEILEKHYNRKG
ncbi:MAG: hypothetical protein QXS32_07750, partial [Candidatus Nezhaarchaeales archaeon]